MECGQRDSSDPNDGKKVIKDTGTQTEDFEEQTRQKEHQELLNAIDASLVQVEKNIAENSIVLIEQAAEKASHKTICKLQDALVDELEKNTTDGTYGDIFDRPIPIQAKEVKVSKHRFQNMKLDFKTQASNGSLSKTEDKLLHFVCFKDQENDEVLGTLVQVIGNQSTINNDSNNKNVEGSKDSESLQTSIKKK